MEGGVQVPVSQSRRQNLCSGEPCKAVIGLSWKPKMPSFSTTKNETSSSSTLYRSDSQVIDGLFLPPIDPIKLNKLFEKQVKETASKNRSAQIMTPELKKDLRILKLRSAIDPKRHYNKGGDSDSKSKILPKNFQVGTVIEAASEYYTGRLTKKERRATLADELLLDGTLSQYRKRKIREIEEVNRPAGVDKWKSNKSRKYANAMKGKEKKRRLRN